MNKNNKNKKIILVVAGVAISAIAIYFLWNFPILKSGNFPEISAVTSAMSVMKNDWNFGEISMKDGNVTHNFELKNEGTEPVVIRKIFTSCMCTTALITDASGKEYGEFGMPGHGLPSQTDVKIAPGKTITVEAIFNPAAHGPAGVGLARRSIYLETNSSVSPKVEVRFSASVTR